VLERKLNFFEKKQVLNPSDRASRSDG